jgi:hypothetical protein
MCCVFTQNRVTDTTKVWLLVLYSVYRRSGDSTPYKNMMEEEAVVGFPIAVPLIRLYITSSNTESF